MTKEEKLEEAKRLYKTANADQRYVLESLFPELKESEDERMRKAIINTIEDCSPILSPEVQKRMIAWLEKQGNTKETINRDEFAQGVLRGAAINLITWIDYNAAEGNMCLSNVQCKEIENALVRGDWDKIYAYMKKKLERQDEQKSIFNTVDWWPNKVDGKIHNIYNVGVEPKFEPKFQNGQWIVWQDKCYKVNCNGCGYELIDQNGLSTSLEYGTVDESAHVWTIADAKDGDVLTDGTTIFIFKDLLSDGSVMSYCDYDTDSGESDAFCPLSMNLMCSKITPATKEQRDLLFAKMKDAGYVWNVEKKELRKIEQVSAWSEDDEHRLKDTIYFLDTAKKHYASTVELDACIDWLKSIKQRMGGEE